MYGSSNLPVSLQCQNCCEMVGGEEEQPQNWGQQHYYQQVQVLMAASVLQTLWCIQLQELRLVCKSTEAVDTETNYWSRSQM